MLKSVLTFILVGALLNTGVFALTPAAHWKPVSDAELSSVTGAADPCWMEEQHDCEGHPPDCNGGNQCNKVGNDWVCHNATKEKYQYDTWEEYWYKCVEETFGLDDCVDEAFSCYWIWTCPTDCYSTMTIPVQHWCEDGTDSQEAGIHPTAGYWPLWADVCPAP